jgi:hypothetical protein
MREFSPGCDAERESLLAAWQGEVMGSREVAEAECQLVRATAREALAYSDRCAARTADHVIARGSLADWCAAQGILAHEFADFHDVARIARAWVHAPEDRSGTGVLA